MRSFALLTALFWLATSAAQAAPPASAYGQLPNVSDVAISPDGKHLAVLRAIGDQSAVEVVNTADLSSVGFIGRSEHVTIRGVSFGSNDRVLVDHTVTYNPQFGMEGGKGANMFEYARTLAADLDGKNSFVLLDKQGQQAGLTNLTSSWPAQPSDPDTVLMETYEGKSVTSNDYVLTMKRVNMKTGADKLIEKGGPDTVSFIVNGAGEIVGRVDRNEITNNSILLSRPKGGGWKEISRYDSGVGGEGMVDITMSDGRFIKFGKAKEGDDHDSMIAIDPNTGAQTTLFTPPGSFDIGGPIADPYTGTAVGVSYLEDLPVQKYFDPALEAVRAKIAAKFGAQGYAALAGWDRARTMFIVHGEYGAASPAYFLYNASTDKLSLISKDYAGLGDADVGDRVSLKYKARDGVSIPAYLNTPHGVPARNLPLVVLVHGGPAARDDFTFDWWSAFVASRGYAVLQPEYRGSAGYGTKWEDAGHKQWGKLMQNDVSDGVGAMIKAGIADPKRVCIIGASYGGYAALAGATLTPELYKCAVAIAGVSDLLAMLNREIDMTGRDSSTVDYWKVSIGDRNADRETIKAGSPIEHVDAVKAPILLMHGPDDTVVPIDQSRAIEKKLKAAGKDVRFVLLKGDDHWLSYAPTRTQMLEELDKFLAENLKP